MVTGGSDGYGATRMPFGNSEGGGVAGSAPVPTPVLENERVRHVGQAIAVVVATDRYIAADAVNLIEVDYEPLPVVTDMEEALKDGAPQLYDHVPNNLAYVHTQQTGDPDAVFVGGGASVPGVVDSCRRRLRPGGRLVVHGVTLETERLLLELHERLGGELTRHGLKSADELVKQRCLACTGFARQTHHAYRTAAHGSQVLLQDSGFIIPNKNRTLMRAPCGGSHM